MAKYLSANSSEKIDLIFSALSDPTRRDIIQRLSKGDLTVGEIARPYKFSLPTISKHLTVLQKAELIDRNRMGREFRVSFKPETMRSVAEYVSYYKKYWTVQIDNLEKFLSRSSKKIAKKRG